MCILIEGTEMTQPVAGEPHPVETHTTLPPEVLQTPKPREVKEETDGG